jgi:hypothetical protein
LLHRRWNINATGSSEEAATARAAELATKAISDEAARAGLAEVKLIPLFQTKQQEQDLAEVANTTAIS